MEQIRTTHNQTAVLHAVYCLRCVSGYNPTIGEVAKVAGVSYGVAYRALEKLCGFGFIKTHVQLTPKIGYRFSNTSDGSFHLQTKGLF
jgi:hypothetical protein